MAINSRRKGAEGELEWARFCKSYGYDVHRTAQYCGNTGEASDVEGLPGVHVEVKRVEALNIDKAMDQSIRDAEAEKLGRVPIVAHRKNRGPWYVTMLAHDWFRMYIYLESMDGIGD